MAGSAAMRLSPAAVPEKPILFSGRLVKRILVGAKSQTRRLINPQPGKWQNHSQRLNSGAWEFSPDGGFDQGVESIPCPYGNIGDRLWVKEKHAILADEDIDGHSNVVYAAHSFDSSSDRAGIDRRGNPREVSTWRPSIFMFRWASRIDLEITGIRAERLQVITESDAKAEGVSDDSAQWKNGFMEDHRKQFARLWDSINAERGAWKSNPWIFAIDFKVLTPARGNSNG